MALGKIPVVATLVSASVVGAVAVIRLRAPSKSVYATKIPATTINLNESGWFMEWLKTAPADVQDYFSNDDE